MFIIKSLAALLHLTLVTAAPRPYPVPNAVPDKTHPELAARTMPLTPPNWTPVINAALSDGQSFGAAGQNNWIVRYPPVSKHPPFPEYSDHHYRELLLIVVVVCVCATGERPLPKRSRCVENMQYRGIRVVRN